MRNLSQTTLLPCSADAFWALFLDEAYLRTLYLDGLGFRGVDVLEIRPSSRKLRIVPKLNLPRVLAKIVGDAFAYEEHGELDRTKNEWAWRMVHPAASPIPELVATRGTTRLETTGDSECRRTEGISIEGKLFGLGRVIESAGEAEARAAWAKELPFLVRRLGAAVP